jgi:hypothetical protein
VHKFAVGQEIVRVVWDQEMNERDIVTDEPRAFRRKKEP